MSNGDLEIIRIAQEDSRIPQRIVMESTTLDNNTAALQRQGYYMEQGFFGDQLNSEEDINFRNTVSNISAFYSQGVDLITRVGVGVRNITDNFYLLENEIISLKNVAFQLSRFNNMPFEAAQNFLFTLVSIDDMNLFRSIGKITGINEFNNSSYIRNVDLILNIPNIYNLSYLAESVFSKINSFSSRFSNVITSLDRTASKYLNSLNILSSYTFSGSIISTSLSKAITGQTIPISILSRNPNLIVPSYAGRAFFGERPTSTVAIDQPYPRRIGVFENEEGATGTQSFLYQNSGFYTENILLENAISQALFGATNEISEYFNQYITTVTGNLANILNVATNTSIELRRSDNAMPFMISLACALVEDTKSPFSDSVFMNSWTAASSVGNFLMRENPSVIRNLRESTSLA